MYAIVLLMISRMIVNHINVWSWNHAKSQLTPDLVVVLLLLLLCLVLILKLMKWVHWLYHFPLVVRVIVLQVSILVGRWSKLKWCSLVSSIPHFTASRLSFYSLIPFGIVLSPFFISGGVLVLSNHLHTNLLN